MMAIKKLTSSQFNKFRKIVYRESGINLTDEKRELLNARISKRIRALGIQPDNYLRLIEQDGHELEAFLNAVSTNHTFFFRESKSFRYLDHNCGNIWCAASSSGEEPYSLAIHCLESGFAPTILATDIATSCLEKGRRGIYPLQCKTSIPNNILKPYFQRGQGQWEGFLRVKSRVRRLVQFERFNLLTDSVPLKHFDIIFCRNVMIYFDKQAKEIVVRKLLGALKPGGYFIIGGAESLNGLNHALKYIEPSVYQKC